MKTFEVPQHYRSSIISTIKIDRKNRDPRKKDFTPTILDFGSVRFLLARHFGFCYGVENAIEIAYKTVEAYPNKRIFFLSEMIHNPHVNADLESKGIQFLMDTKGKQLIGWETLTKEDIVLIPAFGTTIALRAKLEDMGVTTQEFDTTCPFVVKVWNRAAKLGEKQHTILVHGKPTHEETRATFSHSSANAPTLILRNIEEARILAEFILGTKSLEEFDAFFEERYSDNFDPTIHLNKFGVVNQTTMLASETQAIASFVRETMVQKYGEAEIQTHFADTRDTLCYATNDNQQATFGLLKEHADLAIVVGGYNSSNTTHLVELCEEKVPTYFINNAENIFSNTQIEHFNIHEKMVKVTDNFLPEQDVLDIILTSGASCPDALVEEVLQKLLTFFPDTKSVETVLEELVS